MAKLVKQKSLRRDNQGQNNKTLENIRQKYKKSCQKFNKRIQYALTSDCWEWANVHRAESLPWSSLIPHKRSFMCQ